MLWQSHVYFDNQSLYEGGKASYNTKLNKMRIHPCINCDDEVRPLQQALQRNKYSQSYGLSDHMVNFWVVKVFMTLLETKKKFLKLTKYLWVRDKYTPNKQCFIFC